MLVYSACSGLPWGAPLKVQSFTATLSQAAASALPSKRAGLPPSWARKAGVAEAVGAVQQQLERDNMPLSSIRLWRRKLLAFPADRGPRPPAYGSFSRTRCMQQCTHLCRRQSGCKAIRLQWQGIALHHPGSCCMHISACLV